MFIKVTRFRFMSETFGSATVKPNTQAVILGLKSLTDRILHYSPAGHLEACHILLKGVELDQQRCVSDKDLCVRQARTQKHGNWLDPRPPHTCQG